MEPALDRLLESMATTFFGKYRGVVVDDNDSEGLGRLLVQIPAVLGDQAVWALPCVPFAGPDVGFFALPPIGAHCWVEFETGDISYPIWTGCYWSSGQIPAEDASPSITFIRTESVSIRIDDDAGTIEIETAGGARLEITGTEITAEATKIAHTANGGTTELTASGFDAMSGALKVV